MAKKKQRNPVNDAQRANNILPQPRNERQARYIESILQNTQTFSLGPAGTGKTFLAASLAAYLFLRGQIDKIAITRPKVEDEEEWGHLPGNLLRKTAPWTQPVMEILEECLGRQQVIDLLQNGQIEVAPLGFMRGRTFKQSFVLLDEAQNTTYKQMKMFLTRIGEDTRVVINGDIRQKDIRGDSGLGIALQMVEDYNIPAGVVEFLVGDVERSEICKHWVHAFEVEEGSQVYDVPFLQAAE